MICPRPRGPDRDHINDGALHAAALTRHLPNVDCYPDRPLIVATNQPGSHSMSLLQRPVSGCSDESDLPEVSPANRFKMYGCLISLCCK